MVINPRNHDVEGSLPSILAVMGLSGVAISVVAYARSFGRRQRDTVEVLPAGWLIHDGSGCPVPPLSRPAVRFRSGWQSDLRQRPANSWDSSWTWSAHGGLDIVSYQPDPENPDS